MRLDCGFRLPPPSPFLTEQTKPACARRDDREQREEIYVLPLPGTCRSCSPSISVSASFFLPHLVASFSSHASLSIDLTFRPWFFLYCLPSLTGDCTHYFSAAPGFSSLLLHAPSCFVEFPSTFPIPYLRLPRPLFLLYPFSCFRVFTSVPGAFVSYPVLLFRGG